MFGETGVAVAAGGGVDELATGGGWLEHAKEASTNINGSSEATYFLRVFVVAISLSFHAAGGLTSGGDHFQSLGDTFKRKRVILSG